MKNKISNTTGLLDDPAFQLEAACFGRDALLRVEADGGWQAATSDVLPRDGTTGEKAEALCSRLGIVLGDPVPDDDLFRNATLPAGWSKQPDKRDPRHIVLVDEAGRSRGFIFYKGAPYDRYARIGFWRRYTPDYERAGETFKDGVYPIVKDQDKEIWRGNFVAHVESSPENDWITSGDIALRTAHEWLVTQGFADYDNPAAYW